MNIYDEAQQELIEIETYLEHSLEHISKALERAKKVEELNKLLNEKCDYLVHIMNGDKGLQDNYIKLLRKINDLEKELEELK